MVPGEPPDIIEYYLRNTTRKPMTLWTYYMVVIHREMAQMVRWLALADGTRREIVKHLAHGSLAVCELARNLPIHRPAVSQHLKILKSAGLTHTTASGNTSRIPARSNRS